jgi:hypothetical protein
MSKQIAILIILAFAAASVAAGASAAPSPDQMNRLWGQLCANVAKGIAVPNPAAMDCENPRTIMPNFSESSLTVLQNICENAFNGTFTLVSELNQQADCFLAD